MFSKDISLPVLSNLMLENLQLLPAVIGSSLVKGERKKPEGFLGVKMYMLARYFHP
jgi:hypothetical protein